MMLMVVEMVVDVDVIEAEEEIGVVRCIGTLRAQEDYVLRPASSFLS